MQRLSFRESLELYFRRRPNQWVSCFTIAQVAGWRGWSMRLSEIQGRNPYTGRSRMRIERKREVRPNGVVVSFYRWKTKSRGIQ